MKLYLPEPTAKQQAFMADPHKYVCFGGARGGGKSFGIDIMAITYALRYAGIVQVIVRKTYPELYENHITKLKALLHIGDPRYGIARYNDQRKEIIFCNGSRIVFKYCDTLKDLERFQGLQCDILYLDEATQHVEEVWDKLKAIVRGANSFPKKVILTCNPGGCGMDWVKRLFIDRKFKAAEDPDEYGFLQSLPTDNKPLMEQNPDYIKQLESLPPKLRAAWLEGDWNTLEGQFFEEFRIDPDIRAAAEAGVDATAEELRAEHRWCHVIDPIDLSYGEPSKWTILRSYDFGYGKPFSCAWWAVDFEGVLYRIMELYGCTETPNEGVKWTPDKQFAEIAEIERTHPWLQGKKIDGVADPAIWDASRGESIEETASKYGVYFSPGDNHRIPGWMQVHYRMQFDENGYSRLYVFSNCKDFIRTIPLMMYDEHKSEDIDTDLEDHIADETRYLCMSRPVKPIRPVITKKVYSDPLDQFKDKKGNRAWW